MATMKQDKQDGASNYLLKTEPSEYSFADLQKDKGNCLGWSFESGGAKESSGDEAGDAACDLRDWRSEDGGGDGFCGVGGCVEPEESGGGNQGWEDAGEAGYAGANQVRSAIRILTACSPGTAFGGAVDRCAI